MSRYSINLFFVLLCAVAYTQNRPIDLNRKDTTVYKQAYGLRAGIDLSRIVTSIFEDNYTGLELVGDYRLTNKLYLAAELGNEKKTIGVGLGTEVDNAAGDIYRFTASGSYIKAGIDFNTYGNWYGEQNMIYIGGRYAFSTFSQTVSDYKIFERNRYWNPDDFAAGAQNEIEFGGLNASWLEFVVGIKAEMLKNLYVGGSIRLGFLVSSKEPDNFQNQFIPGFNKVTEGSNFGVGYNYSISYLIPLYKKAATPKADAAPIGPVETQPVPENEGESGINDGGGY